jgi:spore maturation protein CgeB
MSRRLKILLAHGVASPAAERWYANVAAAAESVADVRRFCVTLDAPGPRLTWLQLDDLWRRRDRRLMAMYRRLRDAAADCDVLLNYNGINIHPEFLDCLPTFNVFASFDDPEASAGTSAPVAAAFDAAFYGNIASRGQYERFSCRRTAFLPIFVDPTELPPREQRDELIHAPRPIPISMCCEYTPWRAARLDALVRAFPEAQCHGSGWPRGRIGQRDLETLYRQTRIGWNLHNSTGPINQRTFMLAAWGVLQICDNRTGLGQLYHLGDEALGFDTIDEAIDLTRHWLPRDEQRKRITANAFDRFWRDYHPTVVWQRIVQQLEAWDAQPRRRASCTALPRAGVTRRLRFALHDARHNLRQRLRPKRSTGVPPTLLGDQDPAKAGPDQRVALGIDAPLASETFESPSASRIEHPDLPAEPLCWAVTALIGSARRIRVLGSLAERFAALAGVEPHRTLTIGDAQPRDRQPADLVVVIDTALSPGELIDLALAHRADAPRLLLASTRSCNLIAAAAADADTRDVCDWLMRQGQLNLYRLPDPAVPWLTPCDEPRHTHQLIAQWTVRAAEVLRKAA